MLTCCCIQLWCRRDWLLMEILLYLCYIFLLTEHLHSTSPSCFCISYSASLTSWMCCTCQGVYRFSSVASHVSFTECFSLMFNFALICLSSCLLHGTLKFAYDTFWTASRFHLFADNAFSVSVVLANGLVFLCCFCFVTESASSWLQQLGSEDSTGTGISCLHHICMFQAFDGKFVFYVAVIVASVLSTVIGDLSLCHHACLHPGR